MESKSSGEMKLIDVPSYAFIVERWPFLCEKITDPAFFELLTEDVASLWEVARTQLPMHFNVLHRCETPLASKMTKTLQDLFDIFSGYGVAGSGPSKPSGHRRAQSSVPQVLAEEEGTSRAIVIDEQFARSAILQEEDAAWFEMGNSSSGNNNRSLALPPQFMRGHQRSSTS